MGSDGPVVICTSSRRTLTSENSKTCQNYSHYKTPAPDHIPTSAGGTVCGPGGSVRVPFGPFLPVVLDFLRAQP